MAPAELGERFLRVLERIADAAPEAGIWNLRVGPYEDGDLSIEQARENIVKWVEDNIATEDWSLEPDYGYRLMANNLAGLGFSPKALGLAAGVGGRLGDTIRFSVGFISVPPDSEGVTYPLFRSVLLAILSEWPLMWANAAIHVERGDLAVGAPVSSSFPSSPYRVPWFSYLCEPLAAGIDPPAGLVSERTQDGGLLMIAAEEKLDPTNLQHMLGSRIIADIMIARAGNPPLAGYARGGVPWPKP